MNLDLEHIRATTDLYSLVARDTTLKRSGSGWYAGACPFCGGKDRFVLKQTSNGWRWLCRHCTDTRYLDAIDYVQRRDNLSLAEAIRALGGEYTPAPLPKPPAPPPPQAEKPFDRDVWMARVADACLRLDFGGNPTVRAYLQRRCLGRAIQMAAGLGAGDHYDPTLKRERPALWIPYVSGDELTGVKFRFVDDDPQGLRYTSARGSQAGLYLPYGTLLASGTLVVVEGELNALSIQQEFPKLDCVSIGSQTVTERVRDQLRAIVQFYDRVLLWVDEPTKAEELKQTLPDAQVVTSPVADGAKLDANALLQQGILVEFVRNLLAKP